MHAFGISDDVLSGAFAGFVARLFTAPFDVVKIRQQLAVSHGKKQKQTVLSTLRKVARSEGVLALWKGNMAATLLWISYSTVQFGLYGPLNRWVDSRDGDGRHHYVQHALLVFGVGAGSGTVATILTYPFDIMRTQFALQGTNGIHKSIHSYVMHTNKNFGFRGFYGGLAPAILGMVPHVGLNFAIYETLKTMFNLEKRAGNDKSSIIKLGMAGGVAGGISKLATYPLDTVKKRMQAQTLHSTLSDVAVGTVRYSGILNCIQLILKQEGVGGLYKGIAPTIVKSFSSAGITFMAYEVSEFDSNFQSWCPNCSYNRLR